MRPDAEITAFLDSWTADSGIWGRGRQHPPRGDVRQASRSYFTCDRERFAQTEQNQHRTVLKEKFYAFLLLCQLRREKRKSNTAQYFALVILENVSLRWIVVDCCKVYV